MIVLGDGVLEIVVDAIPSSRWTDTGSTCRR